MIRWASVMVALLIVGCPQTESADPPPESQTPPSQKPEAAPMASGKPGGPPKDSDPSENAGGSADPSTSPANPTPADPSAGDGSAGSPDSSEGSTGHGSTGQYSDSQPFGSTGKKRTPTELKSSIVAAQKQLKAAKRLSYRGKSQQALVDAIAAMDALPAAIELETCTASDEERAAIQRGADKVRAAIEKLLNDLEDDGIGVMKPGAIYPDLMIK